LLNYALDVASVGRAGSTWWWAPFASSALKQVRASQKFEEHAKGMNVRDLVAETVKIARLLNRSPVTLVVDQAELGLDASSLEAAARAQTRHALEALVKASKQDRLVNVVLVTSSFSYPYQLVQQLKFSMDSFTKLLAMPELSPVEMRAVMKSWGMGTRLATCFVDVYGGHLARAEIALREFRDAPKTFVGGDVLPIGVLNGIVQCLDAERSGDPSMRGMEELLRTLAMRGFAPLGGLSDPRAELIAKWNLGGVATAEFSNRNQLVAGVWEKDGVGIVPESQQVRLLIAMELARSEK
jgi:hypothetical protein